MTRAITPDTKKLTAATVAAVLIASIVLVTAVLPAEYGIDPLGIGAAAGLTKLNGQTRAPLVDTPPADEGGSLYEMRAVWRLDSLALAEQTGRVTLADREARVVVPLTISNLTSVTATLSWDDTDLIDGQRTGGDTLEVSIRGPGGLRSPLAQATNEEGQKGNVSATLNVRSVPFPRTTDSGDLLMDMAQDERGVGNWTFIVRLYAARGLEGSEIPDPGNNWTLTVSGEAYALDLRTNAQRSGDRVRITLAPDQAIEYKFKMAEGARMSYHWEASGPLHADLHADRASDPENFTSESIMTGTEDDGTYTAPFSGRHGWYWRNDGTAPVILTLETAGEYTILGAVT